MTDAWIAEHTRIYRELVAAGVEPEEANLRACALATEALAAEAFAKTNGEKK